jgi:hypothetical protein
MKKGRTFQAWMLYVQSAGEVIEAHADPDHFSCYLLDPCR